MSIGLERIRDELPRVDFAGDDREEAACRCLLQLCFPQVLPRMNQHFTEPEWIRDLRQEHREDPVKLLEIAGAMIVRAIEARLPIEPPAAPGFH